MSAVQSKKKVLIVDDEPEFAELLKVRLESNGYETDLAEDGAVALEKVKQKPDVILLDIMMPRMDGIEAAKALRGTPETKSIPIIFLTAKDTDEDYVKGYNAGGDCYLAKPYDKKELLDLLQTVLTFSA